MHNRAAIAAIAPRSRSSRRDRGAIANKFLQGMFYAKTQLCEAQFRKQKYFLKTDLLVIIKLFTL